MWRCVLCLYRARHLTPFDAIAPLGQAELITRYESDQALSVQPHSDPANP